MSSLNFKDIVSRAAKTFAQSFVTFVTLSGFNVSEITKWGEVKKIAIAAAVAAATVVWNVVVVPLWVAWVKPSVVAVRQKFGLWL